MTVASGAGARLVVIEHAKRRRLEIIELAASDGAYEGEQRARRQYKRQRKHDRQHAHGVTCGVKFGVRTRNGFDRTQIATTVSELAGMMIAAKSGLMIPAIANAAATAL